MVITSGVQDIENTDSTSSTGSVLSVTSTDTSILYDHQHSHLVARPRGITVKRGYRGFGLSLIYRGLDKYKEKDTGIFVARVVPGGQAACYGVRENDKILTINSKTPHNVEDAVSAIKQAVSLNVSKFQNKFMLSKIFRKCNKILPGFLL